MDLGPAAVVLVGVVIGASAADDVCTNTPPVVGDSSRLRFVGTCSVVNTGAGKDPPVVTLLSERNRTVGCMPSRTSIGDPMLELELDRAGRGISAGRRGEPLLLAEGAPIPANRSRPCTATGRRRCGIMSAENSDEKELARCSSASGL